MLYWQNMFFTIIIPTRNRPADLNICLRQIKLQTYSDYEVLVIDDGSNLKTITQYSESIPKDERFKLVNMNSPTVIGLGASVTRNIGLEKAKGQYITFCDDDDYWVDPDHLKVAHDTLISQNFDMYFANQKAVWEDGRVSYSDWFPFLSKNTHKYIVLSKQNNTYLLNRKQLLKESEIPQLNTLIIKKEICTKINGFWSRLSYLEDRDFYLRALEYCNDICFRKDVVSQHNIPIFSKRISISNSINESDQHILMIAVLQRVIANTSKKEIIKFCKIFLGWKYRNLALTTKNKSQLIFAKNALTNLFTLKWFLFTQFLKIKSTLTFLFRK